MPIPKCRSCILLLVCYAASWQLSIAKSRAPFEADEDKFLQEQIKIKGDSFKFGANIEGPFPSAAAAGSGPAKRAKIKSFAIDATAVTNNQFRRFVRDTNFKTESETYAWSFAHEILLSEKTIAIADREGGIGRVKDSKHWVGVEGAYWRRPLGPDSNIKDLGDHPVVHVSWNDAKAYCEWANGRRLPTEMEWEYAARGGLDDEQYPWADEPSHEEVNGWQGEFPSQNLEDDGYVGTAPVRAYSKPNAYGLHNMLGNVWEWCAGGTKEMRPLRGGSYVDTIDGKYNHALKVWTRMENSADSGSHNTGFRCASGKNKNLEEPPKAERPKPKKKASDLDQNEVQDILAERGVEGLQDWLKEQGVGGSVMTPDQLQKKRDEMQKLKESLKDKMEL